ncbi:MAG: hypothetical protein PHV62_03610 [Sulfuricurvum sp.]|nr:hypothetical protein [Sulfuricurvum sp.]
MSIKENIQTLKDELNSEEKLFESALRTERFVKKYQKPLMGSVISLLLIVGGAIGYQAYDNARVESSNAALNTLLAHPIDKNALNTLENKNAKLYELYTLSKAIRESDIKSLELLQKSQSPEIADMATYETAVLKAEYSALENYTKKQGGMYQDMALLETAVMLIQKGDTKSAQNQLASIKEDSVIYPTAQMLSHFGVKQ